MQWREKIHQHDVKNEILSFDEYMTLALSNTRQTIRTSSIYLKDMFEYYGVNEKGGFNFFRKGHPNCPPIYGQIRTQHAIYQNLKNFVEEGHNNKFILLVGPNGSSKSTLVKKIMITAEEYSKCDEGALYTFSWIFPLDTYVKGQIGLGGGLSRSAESYAHLDENEISAIVSSDLRDDPFLLLPQQMRQEYIDEHFQDYPDLLESIQKSSLYNGDLSKRNRLIYDSLLKSYKGDHEEVLKHIRVERFHVNRRYSVAAATIEPQMHVDAQLQQITMDKRLASLPPSLQSLNLFNLTGEVVFANRGILEFSDLLKRPIDTFKYLLQTMESKMVNLRGILTELDIFFIGSSNEIHFSAFKQHPDFNSFKGRFHFLRVPYLTNFREEMKIYREQIQNISDKCQFEPHALEALCQWSIQTRLRPSNKKHFENEQIGQLFEAMNPLDKAIYIADNSVPETFSSEQGQLLSGQISKLVREYENDPLYEGKFGISPRDIKRIIYDLASEHKNVTFREVLEYLKNLCARKGDFDFLNIAPQGDFHNPIRSLDLIKEYQLDVLDTQVRESLGLVDGRSYEDYISRYVMNINALIKGEKIRNSVTGKFEDPDDYFIKEFENNISLQESPAEFRSHLISTLGAYYLDNPNKEIIYSDVFSHLVDSLKESFRNEQRKIILKVSGQLVLYLEQDQDKSKRSSINQEASELIDNVLKNLCGQFYYSRVAAITLLQYLIQERYHG